ncbi:hypothetical protein [Pararobbsia alpina]|nr:hypothetical protein [Pararobbsia alpina]
MDGLQRAMQSVDFSMLAASERGGFGRQGDGPSGARSVAQPSVPERVYEWCGDSIRSLLGGLAQTKPPARSTHRHAGLAEPGHGEQAGSAGRRERRGAGEDFLTSLGNPHPARRSAAEARPSTVEDFLTSLGNPHPARQSRCNTVDRSDPDAGGIDQHVLPTSCPTLVRTVSTRIPAQEVGMVLGRRTLDGTQGVLTRVRVGLPANAARLTVTVSREGGASGTEVWNRHTGIAGIAARVVSGRANHVVPNIANCRPAESLGAGKQGCSIPVEHGRVDGKRFVTVEAFATRNGTPIQLEVTSQPA